MTLKINVRSIEEKFLLLITTFTFVSFYIFSTFTWGKYVLILGSALVFGVGVIMHNGFSEKLKLDMFHIILIVFCIYCLFSCSWALDPNAALTRTYTMLQILVFFSMLMAYYIKFDSISKLLDIIMWSGYIVSIYTFVFYGGFSAILNMIISTNRLSNQFSNVNSIGMICATACIIQVYKIIYEKRFISSLFLVPTILILAACQSRKSMIMLIFGVLAIVILKNLNNKQWLKSFFKIVVSLVILFAVFRFFLNLEIFSGLNDRLQGLLFFIDNNSVVDDSTSLRLDYIQIGMKYFLKSPIWGHGFGSSHYILRKEVSRNTYFHNNFIELLVNGGLIGFLIYYFNYAYLLFSLIKLRKHSSKETDICIVLLLNLLFMDLGIVSYVEKTQYFYFMVCYLQLIHTKKKGMLKE